MDVCKTTCRQMSTGSCCKDCKMKQPNKLKFNKLINLKLVLRKLDSNLFPHKTKSDSTVNSTVNKDSTAKCLSKSNERLELLNKNLELSLIHSQSNAVCNEINSTEINSTEIKSNNSSNKSIQSSISSNSNSSGCSKKFRTSSLNHKRYYTYTCSTSSLPYLTSFNKLIFLSAIFFIFLLSFLNKLVYCDHINLPPRFVTLPGYSPDIVLTIKEGNSSLNKEIYRLAGEDPNGDKLRFGVMGAIGSDILRIENDVPTNNQATIYLRKELDRETQPSYSLILTLTDGRLAKGSYVSS